MHSKASKRFIRELAEEFGYTEAEIKEMVTSQFKFLKDVIRSSEKKKGFFQAVTLHSIGTFFVSEAKKKFLKNKYGEGEDESVHSG